MGNIERTVELEDFAIYCEAVSIGPPTAAQRGIWQERADWARACAADFRGAVEALREIARTDGHAGVIAANALGNLGEGDPLLNRLGGQ